MPAARVIEPRKSRCHFKMLGPKETMTNVNGAPSRDRGGFRTSAPDRPLPFKSNELREVHPQGIDGLVYLLVAHRCTSGQETTGSVTFAAVCGRIARWQHLDPLGTSDKLPSERMDF